MDSKRWDEILVNEHEMIERAMDLLRLELEKLPEQLPDAFALKRTIDFLLEFGDRIHNVKEEKWLFPLLAERGIPQDGPIKVMLGEHEYERTLLNKMTNDSGLLNAMTDDQKTEFQKNGLEYLEVRANE